MQTETQVEYIVDAVAHTVTVNVAASQQQCSNKRLTVPTETAVYLENACDRSSSWKGSSSRCKATASCGHTRAESWL